MRIIKFRAWDKENRKWKKGDWTFNTWENCDDKSILVENLQNHSLVVMQFTGLKDKNKKEIYEGDIVEVQCKCKIRMEVIFDKGRAGFDIQTKAINYAPHINCQTYLLYNTEKIKVIGNIYENPELLSEVEEGE